jgi:hypothetical protein
LNASECVSVDAERVWYVTNTSTWYKWVLWNTHYDMFFNHETRLDALRTLKWFLRSHHVEDFEWYAYEAYHTVEASLMGAIQMSVDNMS